MINGVDNVNWHQTGILKADVSSVSPLFVKLSWWRNCVLFTCRRLSYTIGVAVGFLGEWGELRMKERSVEKDIFAHKPVSPVTGSGAPCCDGALSGLCLLLFTLNFNFQPSSNTIFGHNFSQPLPNFYSFKTVWKSSKNSQTFTVPMTSNIIETIFRLNEFLTRFLRKSPEICEKQGIYP